MIRNRTVLFLCLIILILAIASCRSETGSGVEFLNKASPQHIRLLSFNIGWDSIFSDDDPQNHEWRQDSTRDAFIRILKAVGPDILCLQEINPDRNPEQVARILDEALPLSNGKKWQAHRGQDNVIVTRFDLTMEAEETLQSGSVASYGHAMALIDLPDNEHAMDMYMICAHFKSAGGLLNIQARQEHADAIIEWIGDIKKPGGEIDLHAGTPLIVLGDFNVYDTDPANHLATLLSGDIKDEDTYGEDTPPDWDDTSLADALPSHNLAGAQSYTWRDDTQVFNPGELDRILYTDSVLRLEKAFVLNTAIMTDEELRAAGLAAGDVALDLATGRYDHLPLIADFYFQDSAAGQ